MLGWPKLYAASHKQNMCRILGWIVKPGLCVCNACREADIDARIRAFKLADPAGEGRLSMDQLASVLQECR
jgi:hypothetical protein